MAAMFDLTELTGARADRARTSVVGVWQVPATWLWPGVWGMVVGLLVVLPLVPLAGPGVLASTFLGAPVAVALTVGGDEALWKRAAHRVRSTDRVFLFCGTPLDMEPGVFYQHAPSAVPVEGRPAQGGVPR